MFERVAFILALAWGAREPEDASMMQMQKKPQAKKLHFLSMGRSGRDILDDCQVSHIYSHIMSYT